MKKYSRRTKLIGAWLAAIALSPTAYAGDFFRLLDKNEDGVLSGSEATYLKPYDSTKDGEITKLEFAAAVASRQERVATQDRGIFAARDGNQDARLSGTEISGYEFADLDTDGRIPLAEFLNGMMSNRNKLGANTPEALGVEALRRFHLMDINEDKRLSGNEAVDMASFDLNEDGRITLDEFLLGTFLDAASASEVPEVNPIPPVSDPIQIVIDAVNRQDDVGLISKLRPELRTLVDGIIVDYLLHHVSNSHGKISLSKTSKVESKAGEQAGSQLFTAKPECAKGSLSIEVMMFDGSILGLVFGSPEVDGLYEKLFAELFADKNEILKSFGEFYSPQCQTMIRYIFKNDEATAIEMFHPEIRAKIGPKAFSNVFAGIRAGCGEVVSMELETAGVALDKSGRGEFFTLSHRVAGTDGTMLIEHKMQFVGLKAHLVAIRGESVKAIPAALATPTTDDDPVPPPNPRKTNR